MGENVRLDFVRYLVTHLMGADLNNIVKTQSLSDDHVQFLVYQILRGLKVRHDLLALLSLWLCWHSLILMLFLLL